MMLTGGSQADVVTLAVDPARWGEGTGAALLTALVDEAEKRGYAEVLLEVREDNPRARRLYLRHGFAEVGIRRGYYQPSGVDAVVMRKALGGWPPRWRPPRWCWASRRPATRRASGRSAATTC